MRKRRKGKVNEADVDMTPMLDIVFIMLIFFIVSSTFIREDGLDLTQHKNDKKPNEATKNIKAIIVQVCKNRDIFIDKRAIDVRSVRANIERKLADDNRALVLIESEADANTGLLVKVIDQAKAAKAAISLSPTATHCS
ncbi:MAG: biopolymer transporter ExbD [Alteromonadaceae bacterium]|nr:MAG: biopolymer transporter ExbD [Alteromonadaceae bacterium]